MDEVVAEIVPDTQRSVSGRSPAVHVLDNRPPRRRWHPSRRPSSHIARTWKAEKAVEAALADQDRVDEDLWR
jgi:hypothetical protein